MSDRIDLAAARALVSGYAPEDAVSVKAGSVLALIDAVEAAQRHATVGSTATWQMLGVALDRFTFGGDAAA